MRWSQPRRYPKSQRVEGFEGNCVVVVDRIGVDRSPWYVMTCLTKQGLPISVVGVFQSRVHEGDEVYVRGEWEENGDYGWQFKLTGGFPVHLDKADLKSVDGVRTWLSRLPQIGLHRADLIVEAFGTDVTAYLEDEPELLLEIPGITPPRLTAIVEAYQREKLDAELLIWLYELGLGDKLIKYAITKYGSKLPEVVKERPYDLMRLPRAKWEEVDACAQAQGFAKDDHERIGAALWYDARDSCRMAGHTRVNETLVKNKAMARLGLDDFKALFEVFNNVDNGWIVYWQSAVSPVDLYTAESTIADHILHRLGDAWDDGRYFDPLDPT